MNQPSHTQEVADSISGKIARGNFRFSLHADKERQRDRITIAEVEEALENPELVEDYPNDPRGHSCLVLGWTASDSPIHAVLGELWGDEPLVIVTIYRPDAQQWIDWRTRR